MTTPGYTVPLSSQSEAPCFETTMPTPEKDSKQPSLGSHICPWKVTEQTGRRYLNRDRGLCGRKQGQEIPERKRGPSTKRGVLFDRPKQQRFTREENMHPRVDYVTGMWRERSRLEVNPWKLPTTHVVKTQGEYRHLNG